MSDRALFFLTVTPLAVVLGVLTLGVPVAFGWWVR